MKKATGRRGNQSVHRVLHSLHPLSRNVSLGNSSPLAVKPRPLKALLRLIFAQWRMDASENIVSIQFTRNQGLALQTATFTNDSSSLPWWFQLQLRMLLFNDLVLLICVAFCSFIRNGRSSEKLHKSLLIAVNRNIFNRFSSVFASISAGTLVISSNFGIITSPVMFAARQTGKRIVYVPHARLSRYYKSFIHDVVYLHRDDIGSELQASLTGQSKVEVFLPSNGPVDLYPFPRRDKIGRSVLIATSLLDHPERLNAFIAALETQGIEWAMRNHPRDRRKLCEKNKQERRSLIEARNHYAVAVSSASSIFFELQDAFGQDNTFYFNFTSLEEPPYPRMEETTDPMQIARRIELLNS